jgi:hypothetical protein
MGDVHAEQGGTAGECGGHGAGGEDCGAAGHGDRA